MPKCDTCEYLCYPEYESSYSECRVFGDEPPKKYWAEDGCKCNKRTLEKILRENEQAREKDMEEYVKWFEQQENNREVAGVDGENNE